MQFIVIPSAGDVEIAAEDPDAGKMSIPAATIQEEPPKIANPVANEPSALVSLIRKEAHRTANADEPSTLVAMMRKEAARKANPESHGNASDAEHTSLLDQVMAKTGLMQIHSALHSQTDAINDAAWHDEDEVEILNRLMAETGVKEDELASHNSSIIHVSDDVAHHMPKEQFKQLTEEAKEVEAFEKILDNPDRKLERVSHDDKKRYREFKSKFRDDCRELVRSRGKIVKSRCV